MKTKTIISLVVAGLVLLLGGVFAGKYFFSPAQIPKSENDVKAESYYPTLAQVRKYCPDLVKNITPSMEVEEGGINTTEIGYMLIISEKKPMPKGGFSGKDAPKTLAAFAFAKEEKSWEETTSKTGTRCSIPR